MTPLQENGYKLNYSYSIALINAIQSYIDTFDFDSGIYSRTTYIGKDGYHDFKKELQNRIEEYIMRMTNSHDNITESDVTLEFIAAFDYTTVWKLDDRFLVFHHIIPLYAMLGISKRLTLDYGSVVYDNFPSEIISKIDNKSLAVMANGAIRLFHDINDNRPYDQKTRLILGPIRLRYSIDNQTQKAVLESAYRFGGVEAKIGGGFDIAELIRILHEQIDVSTNIVDEIKSQIKHIMPDILGRYAKVRMPETIKDMQDVKPGLFRRLWGAIFGSGEGVENDIMYPKQAEDMKEIDLKDIFSPSKISIGKSIAQKAMVYIAAYGDFAEEYPLIAEYGFTAVSGVFQTILGGGLPGLLNFARGEIQAAAIK